MLLIKWCMRIYWVLFFSIGVAKIQAQVTPIVMEDDGAVELNAGPLKRKLRADKMGLRTEALSVSGRNMIVGETPELSFRIYRAVPNKAPEGLSEAIGTDGAISLKDDLAETDELLVNSDHVGNVQQIAWKQVATCSASTWGTEFDAHKIISFQPELDVHQLRVRYRCNTDDLAGVAVNVVYEIHEDYPAIRKWIEIINNSKLWLKVDSLTIDDLCLSGDYRNVIDLTPSDRGAVSSIRAFSDNGQTHGLLQVSEIPSALRVISDEGAMGYHSDHFEWVLGPAEQFKSEPVFTYAYTGPLIKTISAVSTALDRTVETHFQRYLQQVVGIKTFDPALSVPLWCSWSNYGPLINDHNMRTAADIAADIGIKTLLLDAGWSEANTPNAIARFSVVPDTANFPNFSQTMAYLRDKGLNAGLWVTCFRHPERSADLKALPTAYSYPKVERDGALAMSYASNWRFYYANDLIGLYDRYHATYFKQDLTNIKFGDIARGHDSRTHKESMLRGLRGLFEAQDAIAKMAPDVHLELTHEIYWGTPGTPCDVAALKHAHYFHVPPNDYAGAGNPRQRASAQSFPDVDSLRARLIAGCWNARRQFFAHRGLPLRSIEYYGAATVNFQGSLTPKIQQRQLCSWFMGVPSVFAGDLESLSEVNKSIYREGFALLNRLNRQYNVYSCFQFSGVPAPTDTDWHWWGKLNEQGFGAVVVMRGDGGESARNINIPWVRPEGTYRVRTCFTNRDKGVFSGEELIHGKMALALGHYGQEILEIMPANR
jgi:Alpha-galactosidase